MLWNMDCFYRFRVRAKLLSYFSTLPCQVVKEIVLMKTMQKKILKVPFIVTAINYGNVIQKRASTT